MVSDTPARTPASVGRSALGSRVSKARPKPGSLAVYFRSLSVLLSSAVGMERALMLLGDQTEDHRMGEVSRGLARAVRNGSSLSAGMAAYPRAFSEMQVGLAQVGEQTGTLDIVLDRLGSYEERRQALVLKLKSTLTYPAFLAAFSFLGLVLVPPFLFQRALDLTRQSGTQPPLLTRVMMAWSDVATSPAFWPVLLGALVGLGLLGRVLGSRPAVRLQVARRLHRVPSLGRALQTAALIRYARALALQLEGGVNPLVALKLAGTAAGSPVLRADTPAILEGVRDGELLSEAMARSPYLPSAFRQVVGVGEESGRLADLLDRLGQLYEEELDHTLEVLASLAEPLVMLVMGAVVALVVIATLMPMTMLLQSL